MPILGICYGLQLMAYHLGGDVDPAAKREYGPAVISITDRGRPVQRPRSPSSACG